MGQFRQILHVTKLQKNRSPGFGHFFGGNLKKKLPKFYISQKKTLVLGGFSLVILENIRQILNITELDKEKNIPGFGYIYRNQYFFYSYFFCDVAEVVMSMKEGSMFCFVVMRSTKPGCFMLQIMFLVSLESSR